MAWQEREPSVKMKLSKDIFNNLVDILNSNSQLEINESDFTEKAKRLKEKLLTYSIPKVEENGEYIDVRFFPQESSDMIWQLLINNKPSNEICDYYSILLKNREERKRK